jgi:hypothetical protein
MSKQYINANAQVNEIFDKLARKNKKELENAKIKPIHDQFPIAQNGIIAFIAAMGTGKSYNTLKMVALQEHLFDQPFFETVVLCSTSGEFDKTVKTFREAITKSNLIAVKDTELIDWINNYIDKVMLYDALMKFVMKNFKWPCDKMKEIIVHYRLNTKKKLVEFISKMLAEIGWKTHPHRLLLIMDDFASHPLLKTRDSPLSRFLKKLRHFNITVIICVQNVKDVPKELRCNLSDLILFPGLGEEDFKYVIRESSASRFDYRKLWEVYRKI